MWKIKLSIILTISIYIALQLSIPYHSILAQIDNTTGLVTPNNDTNTGGLSNDSGIMHNTTGIIDDAFDALKDSFGSFFGK
ncbi:MAG TPA: hypothetical protein VK566_02525 [Nitrososphaeraceae archaeon]|jgi:hypothetical protein|nr:hypothetical protein [Nitrososphaeraceae archaeon]